MNCTYLLLVVLMCCTANTHSEYGTVIQILSQDRPDQFYNNSLAYYLCEGAGNLTNNTTIILSHTIIHHIPPGSFCLVENVTGLTIYGDSSDNPAVVKCNSTSHHVRGFGFFNMWPRGAHEMYMAAFTNCILKVSWSVLSVQAWNTIISYS